MKQQETNAQNKIIKTVNMTTQRRQLPIAIQKVIHQQEYDDKSFRLA